MKLDQLLLGQIPEAIYFALFMIFTKQLKEKRMLFTVLMILEYVSLKLVFPFNMWFHILYFGISFIVMKILYKERCQITDIFTLGIASLVMITINLITYILFLKLTGSYIITVIINRNSLCIALFSLRNKLSKIQNIYKLFWNRNDKIPKPMKSTTFRCINLVIFNLMFYAINICIIYCLCKRG